MGSFLIDFVPQSVRTGTQKDVFEISVPDSFSLVDGQYVVRLGNSFDFYKAESVQSDGAGNNLLRFVMGRGYCWK
jgi:hypothetical protein